MATTKVKARARGNTGAVTKRFVTPHEKTFHYVAYVPTGKSERNVVVYGSATDRKKAERMAWDNLRAVNAEAARDSLITRLAAHSVVEKAMPKMSGGARVRVSVGRNGRVSLA